MHPDGPAPRTTTDTPPILKIGAVVLRAIAKASADTRAHPAPPREGSTNDAQSVTGHQALGTLYEILILQPIPKHAGEVPPFVLPRGSRQYQAADGQWHDARDVATGLAHVATLETYERALAREIEEEAGVSAPLLARAQVIELGAMDFQSRTKGNYPIYWFVVLPTVADAATLEAQTPADALAVRWATLEDIKGMAAAGEFSAGYIPVIEAALQALHTSP